MEVICLAFSSRVSRDIRLTAGLVLSTFSEKLRRLNYVGWCSRPVLYLYLARFMVCDPVPFFANCRFRAAPSRLRCSSVMRFTASVSCLRSFGVSRFIASASRFCSSGVNPTSCFAGVGVIFLVAGVLASAGLPMDS